MDDRDPGSDRDSHPGPALGPDLGPDPKPAASREPALTLPSVPVPVPVPEPADAAMPPRFPGADQGTGVVLHGADTGVGPNTLRAHWRVTPDDQARAGGSFPHAGARPMPVLRLYRARPGGGAEPADEAALLGVARAGAGETSFQVAADHGRYHAELGLANADGGWLMLARSNTFDNVSPVGVDLPRRDARRHPTPGPADPTPTPTPMPPRPASAAIDVTEPALASAPPGSLAGVFPLVQWVGLGPAEPASAGAVGPVLSCAPEHQDPDAERTTPVGYWDLSAVQSPASLLTQRTLEGRPLRLPRSREPGEGGGEAAPEPAPAVAADVLRMGPIATLTYGQSPSAATGVQVEAELRITGQAAPGSLIDLFGHPFRVGPGGRFQLVVRVTDPSLLRQALDLEPPPELAMTREP